MFALYYKRVNEKWHLFNLNGLYLVYVINRILNSWKFIIEFIALVE
jgi:hypothetical protein